LICANLKKRLELDAEIERSASPESSAPPAVTDGNAIPAADPIEDSAAYNRTETKRGARRQRLVPLITLMSRFDHGSDYRYELVQFRRATVVAPAPRYLPAAWQSEYAA